MSRSRGFKLQAALAYVCWAHKLEDPFRKLFEVQGFAAAMVNSSIASLFNSWCAHYSLCGSGIRHLLGRGGSCIVTCTRLYKPPLRLALCFPYTSNSSILIRHSSTNM